MAALIIVRIIAMVYWLMFLDIEVGYYGNYQIPIMYPIYCVMLMLCFVYLARKDLQYISIIPFHIFTLLFMSFDVLIFVLSIGKPYDYWIF
jgi:hypothetical protein